MGRTRRTALITIAASALAAGAVGAAELSAKSTELVDIHCVGELAEDRLTLFANGTVRVRERVDQRERMLLAELERSELDGFVARLEELDFSEVESQRVGITGEWIAQCALDLTLRGHRPVFFRYGRFDVVPHAVQMARMVLDEIETLARARAYHGELPEDYEPQPGDFVRRTDGELFEVVGSTSDGRGVELNGIDQPITIYVAIADFRNMFVAKEEKSLLDLER